MAIIMARTTLGDACKSFNENCAQGIEPNHAVIKKLLNNSYYHPNMIGLIKK